MYWAALLWRKMMGTTVLESGVPVQPGLHVYATVWKAESSWSPTPPRALRSSRGGLAEPGSERA